VPLVPAIFVSFKQVSAMVVGTITPALILAGVLKFSPADTAYFVSIALLASAVGTFLQTRRYGIVGSGLLSVTGTSFAFLGPLIQAGQTGGLALMFGMSLAAAPVQLIFAPFLPKLQRGFAPIVSGVVVLLIGLSLIPTAMFGIAAPVAPGAPPWAGLLIAATVVAVVLLAQSTGRTWARLGSVLFDLIAGYLVCGLAGWLQAPAPGDGT
jgi:NCS2 family nucleobase:cation symporter-2/xanthine permease XanP